MNSVITRFAPSPTGYLHVGGARTALFCWLLARHSGGQYLLRIEDTDLARSTTTAADQLLEDLRWLGLQWDNSELVYQSKRTASYNAIIDDLIAKNLAYKAYDTRAEIDAMRKIAEKEKKQFLYRRRDLDAATMKQYESENRPHVVRFAMPVKSYTFADAVLGEISIGPDEVQDFVIRKEDGMPTYHFAVVVDDQAMNITHVLRGQEHTKNTFNHIALQEALGYPRPIFAHLSTIQNPDGSKMGKRDRDKVVRAKVKEWMAAGNSVDALASGSGIAAPALTKWIGDSKSQLDLPEQNAISQVIQLDPRSLPEILVHDFRKNGYLPEAILNFLALLGWNPGGNAPEQMSPEKMVELFSLERVHKANPKFDRAKLLAFNTEACAAASESRLLAAFRDYLSMNPDAPQRSAADEQIVKLLRMKKGFRTLREVDEPTRTFFVNDEELSFDPIAVEKALSSHDGEGFRALRAALTVLVAHTDWSAASLEGSIKSFAESNGLGLGKIAQPIRVAITGSTVSPPLFDSLEFLGKPRSIRRIERCLALQSESA